MSQQDDELMFSIGVQERPDTKARLDAIAKSMEEVQSRFDAGAVSIAGSIASVKTSVTSVVDQIRQFGGGAASSYSLITAAIAQLRSVASQPITQTVSMVVDSGGDSNVTVAGLDAVQTDARAATKSISDLQKQAGQPAKVSIDIPADAKVSVTGFDEIKTHSKVATDSIAALQAQAAKPAKLSVDMPEDLKAMFDSVGAQIEGLRDKAMEGVEVDFGLPKNLQSVFMEFADVSIEAADKIEESLDKKIISLAEPMSVATAQIRQEYAKRVADQAKAYEKMSEQMDKAVNRQMLASEMQGEAVKRATHGLIAGVKGFVQLGLVGEESSEKILKGLVAIEGATSMLSGGVDVLSALSKGWRSVRQSTDAANQVAKISAAMAGPHFLQLRAYHAQLLQETVAANAAAAANMRLAASRGGKGLGGVAGAVGTAGSLVDGAKQVSGLASTASKVGSVAATAGTVAKAGGSLAPAVAVVGAGIGAGLVATIAAAGAALAAVSLVAVELSETFRGTATKAGSLNDTIASSYVGIAASALRLTGVFEKTDSIGTQFAQTMARNVDATLGTIPVIGRLVQSLNVFGDVAGLAASSAAVQRAEKRLAIAKINAEGNEKLDNVNRDAGNEIATMGIKSKVIGIRDRAETGTVNDKLQGEMQIQALAAKELAKYQREAANASNEQGRTSEKYRDSISMVKTIQDQITESYHKQKSLVGERAKAELQSQSQIAEGLKKQLDQTMQGIESVKGGYKSAALNFAKLGDIEKQQAIEALSLAKTKGAGALDESQRDLLRSVGGKQATDFADQADMMESRKAGFDQSFGKQFSSEGLQLESTQRTLEAQIKANYSTTVKIDFDSKLVVQSVVDQASKILAERNAEMTLAIQEGLTQQESKIRLETQSRLSTQRANRG